MWWSLPGLSPSPNHTGDKMLRPWPGLATCSQDLPTPRAFVLATTFSLCLLVLWVSAWTLPPHTHGLAQSIICCPCHVPLKHLLVLPLLLMSEWCGPHYFGLSSLLGAWSWCLGLDEKAE